MHNSLLLIIQVHSLLPHKLLWVRMQYVLHSYILLHCPFSFCSIYTVWPGTFGKLSNLLIGFYLRNPNQSQWIWLKASFVKRDNLAQPQLPLFYYLKQEIIPTSYAVNLCLIWREWNRPVCVKLSMSETNHVNPHTKPAQYSLHSPIHSSDIFCSWPIRTDRRQCYRKIKNLFPLRWTSLKKETSWNNQFEHIPAKQQINRPPWVMVFSFPLLFFVLKGFHLSLADCK